MLYFSCQGFIFSELCFLAFLDHLPRSENTTFVESASTNCISLPHCSGKIEESSRRIYEKEAWHQISTEKDSNVQTSIESGSSNHFLLPSQFNNHPMEEPAKIVSKKGAHLQLQTPVNILPLEFVSQTEPLIPSFIVKDSDATSKSTVKLNLLPTKLCKKISNLPKVDYIYDPVQRKLIAINSSSENSIVALVNSTQVVVNSTNTNTSFSNSQMSVSGTVDSTKTSNSLINSSMSVKRNISEYHNVEDSSGSISVLPQELSNLSCQITLDVAKTHNSMVDSPMPLNKKNIVESSFSSSNCNYADFSNNISVQRHSELPRQPYTGTLHATKINSVIDSLKSTDKENISDSCFNSNNYNSGFSKFSVHPQTELPEIPCKTTLDAAETLRSMNAFPLSINKENVDNCTGFSIKMSVQPKSQLSVFPCQTNLDAAKIPRSIVNYAMSVNKKSINESSLSSASRNDTDCGAKYSLPLQSKLSKFPCRTTLNEAEISNSVTDAFYYQPQFASSEIPSQTTLDAAETLSSMNVSVPINKENMSESSSYYSSKFSDQYQSDSPVLPYQPTLIIPKTVSFVNASPLSVNKGNISKSSFSPDNINYVDYSSRFSAEHQSESPKFPCRISLDEVETPNAMPDSPMSVKAVPISLCNHNYFDASSKFSAENQSELPRPSSQETFDAARLSNTMIDSPVLVNKEIISEPSFGLGSEHYSKISNEFSVHSQSELPKHTCQTTFSNSFTSPKVSDHSEPYVLQELGILQPSSFDYADPCFELNNGDNKKQLDNFHTFVDKTYDSAFKIPVETNELNVTYSSLQQNFASNLMMGNSLTYMHQPYGLKVRNNMYG